MSSRNTGEEARQRSAEEEKELDASVDHERLARLVAANSPSAIEDGRRAEAEAQRLLEEAHRRAEAERSDKKRPRNLSAGASGYAPVLLQQQQPPSAFYQPVAPAPAQTSAGKKSLMPLMLIAAVLGVAVLGGGIGAYLMLSSGNSSGEKTTQTSPSRPGDAPNRKGPVDTKQEMIAIPGGTFMMGQNGGHPAEAPAHSVTVSDFSMDRTEVTNAEYAEFVNETKRTPPQHWPGGKVLSGQEFWPVSNVSIDDAEAFAAWRSKRDGVTYRLPTEEEWEYAARNGGQSTFYPWGDSWANDVAVIKTVSPQEVGSHPNGKNRWGVVDLIGNVWEWTSSKGSLYPGSSRTIPEQDKESYVMRGGSYASDASGERAVTAVFRDWIPASTKHTTLGFRLVRAGS